nr:sulfite exporter TauE/SafE family protein [Notoacmeibacter sp. MSK16QG-6]
MIDWGSILIVFVAFGLGGVLKGATGAGAPLIAVPLLATLYDVPFAVAVFSIPNVISNAWQAWTYRKDLNAPGFALTFAVTGAIGALVGTLMLASLPPQALLLAVALVVFAYVAFRFSRPSWQLSWPVARRIVVPVGIVSGGLYGATGVSAPVSLTFLNALRLNRPNFVATISLFFFLMAIPQLPMLFAYEILTPWRALLGAGALIPILLFMPVGAWLAKRISPEKFDRAILVLLTLLACKILFDAL